MQDIDGKILSRLLVANRGEIAERVISSARELKLTTIALYTEDDVGHVYNADEVIKLKSVSSYLDVDELLTIVKDHNIDSVHPGYGFLSESAEFARRMSEIGVLVVGPGHEILEKTGDKLRARELAQECGVPVLPALENPTSSVDELERFARQNLPIMVKAVDGGGGRGQRLVRRLEDLRQLATRAIEESPSRQVFAERAAIDEFRHVEVQIVGDQQGNVMHLFERECSIQRRYQKVIEIAPSTLDRTAVQNLIDAALRIANKIRYKSLGTFEFLVNPVSEEFFFLEINPRLQVEHTITESITGVDLVKAQLRLAQGCSLQQAGLPALQNSPSQFSIQLRVVAEDVEKNWTLSAGKIASFRLPRGNGVRVDTALIPGAVNIVGTDFDSVIMKLILTASTWEDVVSKAQRAVQDTEVSGVKTNLTLLAAMLAHPDFVTEKCDTQWLESKHDELVAASKSFSPKALHGLMPEPSAQAISVSTSSTLFRKDDAWSIDLTPTGSATAQHHLKLQRVLRNDFPSLLSAQIAFTAPNGEPVDYLLELKATNASASALSAQHRRGDPNDSSHVIIPFSGKLVEISVDIGQVVRKGDCIVVIQQMKMELEVRSPADGIIAWICDVAEGEDVAEGILAVILQPKSKL